MLLCRQREKCFGGSCRYPSRKSRGSALRCSSRQEDDTWCSTPQRPSWPPTGARKPFATASGSHTAPHQTHKWMPPGLSSASPSTTTQPGTHDTTRNQSYLSNLCDAHLMYQATKVGSNLPRTPSGPCGLELCWLVGGLNSSLFDWEAHLI